MTDLDMRPTIATASEATQAGSLVWRKTGPRAFAANTMTPDRKPLANLKLEAVLTRGVSGGKPASQQVLVFSVTPASSGAHGGVATCRATSQDERHVAPLATLLEGVERSIRGREEQFLAEAMAGLSGGQTAGKAK